jgi:cytosine/adenosine deaminase-related metal-dependent hydrolase
MAFEVATRGGAGCLGREGERGELSPGTGGDVAVWKLDGPVFAVAIADPFEAWLRCGPSSVWCAVVHGRRVVDPGRIVHPGLPEVLAAHTRHARRIQRL